MQMNRTCTCQSRILFYAVNRSSPNDLIGRMAFDPLLQTEIRHRDFRRRCLREHIQDHNSAHDDQTVIAIVNLLKRELSLLTCIMAIMQIRRGDLKIVFLLGVLFASWGCCVSLRRTPPSLDITDSPWAAHRHPALLERLPTRFLVACFAFLSSARHIGPYELAST
jgi:hypothetical protein